MKNTHKTSEVAKIIGIHPNTVRLYEEWGLIPAPERKQNGYRVFTDFHIAQFKLARTALQVEVLQNGLRKKAMEIIKTSATGNLAKAESLANEYLQQIMVERQHAEEAIMIARRLLSGEHEESEEISRTRKETADYLAISMDILRNWELNGLLTIKRKQNGYRIYTDEDIRRLKIIRSLRCANYSLSAILRMLGKFDTNPEICIKKAIDNPDEADDIIRVCDKLLTSLRHAAENAQSLLSQLAEMKIMFSEAKMNIEIRKLTPMLADDYTDFFDTTPHNDSHKGDKCYTTNSIFYIKTSIVLWYSSVTTPKQ